jgi:hypothetical protein
MVKFTEYVEPYDHQDLPDMIGVDEYGNICDAAVPWYDETWARVMLGMASLAGSATGAYHGYKRHHGSVGWAVGWALLGGIFPIITIPLSLAEGFGKPE